MDEGPFAGRALRCRPTCLLIKLEISLFRVQACAWRKLTLPLSRAVSVIVTPTATPWTSRTTSAWLWLSWMWLQLITAGAADQVFAGGPTVLTTPVTAVTSQHDDDAAESPSHDLSPARCRPACRRPRWSDERRASVDSAIVYVFSIANLLCMQPAPVLHSDGRARSNAGSHRKRGNPVRGATFNPPQCLWR